MCTYKSGIHHDISGNVHSIEQVPLDLHQDIFRGTPQQNSTSLRVHTLGQECKVFLSEFLDLKQTTFCSNISFLELLGPVDNATSDSTGDTVHVRLSETTDGSDVGFEEEVLGKVRNTFLWGWKNVESSQAHTPF